MDYKQQLEAMVEKIDILTRLKVLQARDWDSPWFGGVYYAPNVGVFQFQPVADANPLTRARSYQGYRDFIVADASPMTIRGLINAGYLTDYTLPPVILRYKLTKFRNCDTLC